MENRSVLIPLALASGFLIFALILVNLLAVAGLLVGMAAGLTWPR